MFISCYTGCTAAPRLFNITTQNTGTICRHPQDSSLHKKIKLDISVKKKPAGTWMSFRVENLRLWQVFELLQKNFFLIQIFCLKNCYFDIHEGLFRTWNFFIFPITVCWPIGLPGTGILALDPNPRTRLNLGSEILVLADQFPHFSQKRHHYI